MEEMLRTAVDQALRKMGIESPPDYVVEKPKDPRHGDLAANVAFLLARSLHRKPQEIGLELVEKLELDSPYLQKIEVAPNGFINFFIDPRWCIDRLAEVQREGERYGLGQALAGRKVMVEFVSSNPTGPLTIGHGRQAVLGDCLSSVLEAQGAAVCREYYYNDAGNQMNILGRSLRARYAQLFDPAFPFPENGYKGDYMLEIGPQFAAIHGERYRPAGPDDPEPDPADPRNCSAVSPPNASAGDRSGPQGVPHTVRCLEPGERALHRGQDRQRCWRC